MTTLREFLDGEPLQTSLCQGEGRIYECFYRPGVGLVIEKEGEPTVTAVLVQDDILARHFYYNETRPRQEPLSKKRAR